MGPARARASRAALIVTDGVFSMDGDVAPVAEIVELAGRHGARVMVDEAHGTGALGPGGRGACAEAGVADEVDVLMGTLGKALGSQGAFVACDAELHRYLLNTARTFIFSTAPRTAGGRRRPRRARAAGRRSWDGATASARGPPLLRDELHRAGLRRTAARGPRSCRSCSATPSWRSRICERAIELGVFAQAIRPRRCPPGTSRLRLAVMATHTEADLRSPPPGRSRGPRPSMASPLPAPPWARARSDRRRSGDRARAVRHRNRHRRRQVGRRGGDHRRAARRRRPTSFR